MAILLFTGCSATRNLELAASRMIVSSSTEQALGNQYHGEIEKQYEIINDPAAQAWLDRVGALLVAYSPPTKQEFKFYLTASPAVNAFAIPGGHCYINVGLINYAENEAQVVAVVGHEINHVTRRHGIVQVQRNAGLQAVVVAGSFLIRNPAAKTATILAGSGGTYLASRKFGRDDEREADKYGVEAMYQAGYDPREGARFFERLNALYEGNTPSWLESITSTHPPTLERVKNINKQVESYDLNRPLIVNSPEFEAIQARLRVLYPPEQDTESGS
ncbi:MAG: M48 family metalloprotease [Candidatus Sumerlaeia bacterium]|nr:M48 family metalloprotease [Candidatus Sumerlaeia bacterium]